MADNQSAMKKLVFQVVLSFSNRMQHNTVVSEQHGIYSINKTSYVQLSSSTKMRVFEHFGFVQLCWTVELTVQLRRYYNRAEEENGCVQIVLDRRAEVLSGCGVNDGTEVHEASAVLSHITRNKAVPHMFAPDMPQMDIINHLECKQDSTHCRNVLVESARIARGQILPLSELAKNCQPYDAVVFPGGFGAAKNLSDFASKGVDCTVIPDVETVLKEFHKAKKPIGLTCIAPILAAKVICGVFITLGQNSCDEDKWPYKDAIKAAEQMGAMVENKDVNESTFDRKNFVFSTPAYMYGAAQFHEVDDGIGGMIKYMMMTIKDAKLKG